METVTSHRAEGSPASADDEPILEIQFDDLEQQHEASTVGMWLFLATEVMFFGGLITAYAIYRSTSPREFALASEHMKLWLGFLNTVILLVSSFTMEKARRQAATQAALAPVTSLPGIAADRRSAPWLSITFVLGIGFLVGQVLAWRELAARGFFLSTGPSSSFVYLLTGMHALHLAGGVLALLYSEATGWLHKPIEARRAVIDTTAWYWHFMALLWIYIFALIQIAR